MIRVAVTLLLIASLVLPSGVALAAGPATNVGFVTGTQTKTVGDSVTVTAKVTDGTGAAVSNIDVSFVASGSNSASGTIKSDGNGQASFTYSGSNIGPDTVTASIDTDTPGGSTDTITVNWVSPPEDSIVLSPSEATPIVNSQQTLTATVKNGSNRPVENVTVNFKVEGTNSGSESKKTNASGVATFAYSSVKPGTDTVTASTDDGNGGTISDEASIDWVQPNIDLEPATATNAITVTQTMTATVTDDSGLPLQGISVRFKVEGTNPQEKSVLSGSDGRATFSYTSTKTGIDTITAYPDTNRNSTLDNGEPKATATISWESNPATGLTLNQSSATAIIGNSHTLTATVRDPSGNPSSGVAIRFTVTGVNPKSAVTRTTNSDGVATFAYTGANTGNDTVKAYADVNGNSSQDSGEPSASATVTWGSNVPSSLTLSAGNGSPAIGSSDTFTATVKNSVGTALPGVTVRFSVSGANSASGNSSTDSNGKATFSYSGANAGDDNVTAYADTNGNGVRDNGEPAGTAKVTWSSGSASPSPSPSPGGHFGPADPASPNPNCTYFPETKHNLCGGFRDYWNTYGGLAVYGFPLTEEFQENGVTTQYFERERFEWHPGMWPERSDVLLGLLGDTITTGRSNEAPFQPAGANGACTYYSETHHNLCGGFRDYWNNFGGLAVYGFPISEEFQERNPDDGKVYTVQYFERGRFEWHPGAWPERSDVMLGRLGAQVLQSAYGVAS